MIKRDWQRRRGHRTITGDVTISADGVTLQNTVIEGDLTITSRGQGDGQRTLQLKDHHIYGGGDNTMR